MDMYTMNENFIAEDVVDEFISAIWTERYSAAGDVQLVTAATPEMVEKLAEGTFLGLRGTKEVMQLSTQSIEDNRLTVVGPSLTKFLDERPLWTTNPTYNASEDDPSTRVGDYTVTAKVGQAIADVVESMVINTESFSGAYVEANLDDLELNEIAMLEIGDVDTSGEDERMTFIIGPLYQAVEQVAVKFGMGIQLYLDYATVDSGYLLKFKTYKGIDRTTDASDENVGTSYNKPAPGYFVPWGAQLVRLVPDMDSLSNIKEIRSISYYKNVAYVYYDGEISTHYEDPLNPPEGFNRRVLVTNAEGEPVGRKATYITPGSPFYGGGVIKEYTIPPGPEEIAAFREQHAKDALANHNYIKTVDGQTSPHNDYTFGVDYGLGDIIELQGLTGTLSKARVTEYIRSQDRTGEREYPTISVL